MEDVGAGRPVVILIISLTFLFLKSSYLIEEGNMSIARTKTNNGENSMSYQLVAIFVGGQAQQGKVRQNHLQHQNLIPIPSQRL